jgi:flagellar M-ring protein FliF
VLVSGALGLQTERGDQLVVETLPFETTLQSPPAEIAPPVVPAANPRYFGVEPWMLAAGAGGLVVLAILAFAVSRTRRKRSARVRTNVPLPPGTEAKALASGGKAAAGGIEDSVAPSLQQLAPEAAKMDRLVTSVRSSVTTDPALVAGVLRNWLEER